MTAHRRRGRTVCGGMASQRTERSGVRGEVAAATVRSKPAQRAQRQKELRRYPAA